MPLKPSHNLLVRGSNPCGGTKGINILDIIEMCSLRLLVCQISETVSFTVTLLEGLTEVTGSD